MGRITDIGLLRLAHVALITADPERLADYYEANVGLVRVGGGDDGAIRLTTDRHHHCLELHAGDTPALHHIAFEVRDVQRATAALEAGAAVRPQAVPAVGYADAATFRDPEGNAIRLVSGTETSDVIAPGSRTFRPRKIGHIGVRAADPDALSAFYTDVIGFRLSDWIGKQVVFLRCNPDHHALVFVAEPPEGSSVHHVAFEVESWEGFARQADMLAANGISIGWGPGRHAPSQNYFMYFDDADGNRIEWMAGVRQITDEEGHTAVVFDPAESSSWNVWGVMPPAHFLNRIGPGSLAGV
jgi:catechol 2,3-dioxygenase-like lactoylglutathione lyase family enzyme